MPDTPTAWSTTGDLATGPGRWITLAGPFYGVLWTDDHNTIGIIPAAPTVDGQAEAFDALRQLVERARSFDEVVLELVEQTKPAARRYLVVKVGDLGTWRETKAS